MRAGAIRDSVRQAPGWDKVAFAETSVAWPDETIAVVGYRAEAKRAEADADPYRCLCTSTYRRTDDGWRIVQHQQSPID